MKIKLTKPIAHALIGLTMIASVSTANAGLKEALNSMFVSASTDPQMIETQRLKGFYGGSMNLRPISGGISIVQFAPPRIDAGCGGIDIFFGSFSFINGAQFEQLIRSIAANAVGFAIKAAIKGMCEPCGNIIDGLEAAMRELNAMSKNTCAIAKAFLPDKDGEDARSRLMDSARKIGNGIKLAFGKTSDPTKSENENLAQTPNEAAQAKTPGGGAASAAMAEQQPLDGNVVYLAAEKSLNAGVNTLSAFMSKVDVTRIIMGLYGVVIYNPDKTQACPAGAAAESCVQDIEIKPPTITTWDNLMFPRKHSQDGVKVWQCAGSDCRNVVTSNIPFNSWGGAEEAVNLGLFGTSELPVTRAQMSADSLVGAVLQKTDPSNLSQHARIIMKIVPMPILNLLMEAQSVPGAPEALGYQLADILPQFFAYQLALELHTIGSNVFATDTKKTMPGQYAEALRAKARDLMAIRPDPGKMTEIMNGMFNSLKLAQEITTTQYRASGAKTK